MKQLVGVLVAVLALACSGNTPSGGGQCSGNKDCDPGQVCSSGACISLCRTDRDCGADRVCDDGVCVAGVRSSPRIDAVDGDGTVVCPDAAGTHCIAAGLLVLGDNLEGATFTLSGSGAPVELVARDGAIATSVALELPDVAPGTYTLTAANGAGSADQALQLLQGPPGPDLTPNQLVDRVNQATNVIAVQRLPVGVGATDVAAGNHVHAASAITGVFDASQLPVGTAADTVAAGDHTHAYLPLAGGNVTGSLTVGGQAVCRADGTGCPVDKSTYTVWGTTTCGSGHTQLYTGRAAATIMAGGGAGAFCLSDAITAAGWVSWDGGMVWRANATSAGVRGQYANGSNDIRCAVCQGSVYVNWGQQTCATGFSTVYSGYLAAMGGSWSGGWAPSEPICLESSAGANWTAWADGMVIRGIGSSGSNRVEYQNANDILCRVCQ